MILLVTLKALALVFYEADRSSDGWRMTVRAARGLSREQRAGWCILHEATNAIVDPRKVGI